MYKMETLFAVVAITGVIAASGFAYNYYSKYNNIPQAPLPDFNNTRTFSNQSSQTYNSLDNQNNLTYSDLFLASPISKETPFLTDNYSTAVLVRTGEIDKDYKLHLKFLGVNENVIDKIISTSILGVNTWRKDSDKLILNIHFEQYQRTEFDEDIGSFTFFTLPYKKVEKIKKLPSGYPVPNGVYAYGLKSSKEWNETSKIFRNKIYLEIGQSLKNNWTFAFPHTIKPEKREWGAVVPSDIKETVFSGADDIVVFATDKISKAELKEVFEEIVNEFTSSSGSGGGSSSSIRGGGGGSILLSGGGSGSSSGSSGSSGGSSGGSTGSGGGSTGGSDGGGSGGTGGSGGGSTPPSGGGNTGVGNSGSGNVGVGNSGSGNTGVGNSGSGNVGVGNSGSGNVGVANSGSGNVGVGNT